MMRLTAGFAGIAVAVPVLYCAGWECQPGRVRPTVRYCAAPAGRVAYSTAGTGPLHLAKWADRVTVLARGESLAGSMSDYLIRQIGATPDVEVFYRVQVAGGAGTGHLESLVLEDTASGARRSVPADALFVLIGSQPRTQWLGEAVARDQEGFILTGPDLPAGTGARWPPAARRYRCRPACPGCSRPATCAADRSNGSLRRWARVRSPFPWCTATWKPSRPHRPLPARSALIG
jgi:hypothetical protein